MTEEIALSVIEAHTRLTTRHREKIKKMNGTFFENDDEFEANINLIENQACTYNVENEPQ
jgi:hypothetical protein